MRERRGQWEVALARTVRLLVFAWTLGGSEVVACSVYTPDLLLGADPVSGGGTPSSGGSGSSAGSGGASSNAGGEPSTGGHSMSGGSGGVVVEPFLYELIDDMEGNTASILPIKMRNGRWNVANDGTVEGEQVPEADFTTMHALSEEERPHAESEYCAYTRGSGFTDWGAFLNVSMRSWPVYEETPTYDLSSYRGIAFYAKAGENAYKVLRVRYVSASTDPRGGDCEESGPVGVRCFDHFYHDLLLTDEWTYYNLLFDDFQQAGTGKQFPDIDLEQGYGFEFYLGSNREFEVWIDDLSFILRDDD